MYIKTHNDISDTKSDVETKMRVSYTTKYVTAIRCGDLNLQGMLVPKKWLTYSKRYVNTLDVTILH